MGFLGENVSLVKGIFVAYGFDPPVPSGFNPTGLIKLKKYIRTEVYQKENGSF